MNVVKTVLGDLVKLKRPATASAIVAFVVAVVGPFGLDLSGDAQVIAGLLGAIGVVAAFVDALLFQNKLLPRSTPVEPPPPPKV